MKEFVLPHDHGMHKDTARLYEEVKDEGSFQGASELFKLLSDTARIRIFWLLSHEEECVINLSALLGMTAPAVAHHLRLLRDAGVIESRKEGKEVYYRVADSEKCMLLHRVTEKMMEIECPFARKAHAASSEEIARRVHDYLVMHLGERTTIEALAKHFLINPTTLKQSFRSVYRTSIAAHINVHRMEKAAEMLREGEESVSAVAVAVGFSAQSRFTEAFKKHFGVLPTEYRKSALPSVCKTEECHAAKHGMIDIKRGKEE